jgi:hypothetical protein
MMQSASDLFLGWAEGDRGRQFYVRQLKDMKIKPLVDVFTPGVMLQYADFCGWTLAHAHARSGDKGDTGNVGVIARKQEHYPLLVKYLTVERVKKHFEGITLGRVERFEMPNLGAINFLLHESLGGGGTKSLKNDAQGKTLSSAMLRMELDIDEPI